ncbi:MAG: hypothetical protein J7M21_05520, partial [Planctomycetes bacterium]|nr:hypothetical protein [Planctomycetota bacterium]
LFTSSLVLVTPLKMEVQEDTVSGRVRANVLDAVAGRCVPEVYVKAVGSADGRFRSGQTDLRGIFVADGIRGKVTVIARQGRSRYAFYRGETYLGKPSTARGSKAPQQGKRRPQGPDFQKNLRLLNETIQQRNFQMYDKYRRQGQQKGIQVQMAK